MKERLTILGSGVCVSGMGWEKKDRWPPCYLLEGIGPELVMLEATEGARYRLWGSGFEYTQVSDILISHLHPDHFDLVPFVQSVAVKKSWSQGELGRDALNIYGPTGIKEAFWKIWEIMVPEHPKSVYGDLLKLNFTEFADGETVDFYNSRLSAFAVFHAYGKVEALAYRLETPQGIFTYSGDSSPCEGLEKAAKNASVFLCDCSSDIGEDKSKTSGHLNPYQAGSLAKEVGVKKLWLTHYSGKDSPKDIVKECRRSGFGGEILVVKDKDKLRLFEK